MRKCPLTYEMVEGRYAPGALRRLNPRLDDLQDLRYSAEELLHEVSVRADKLSIQGVQPKLSARINVKSQAFELVDRQGQYILKPPSPHFAYLPENEDCTMRLAAATGLNVPNHGLVYGKDGRVTFWIRRFDRTGRDEKLPVEDFAQLLGESRDTKYNSSWEKVSQIIERYCTFPRVEAAKLFKLLLFCFLCGNEDQHLKNFSLLVKDPMVELSPCYDQVNSTIVLSNPKEELALTLAGKKSRLKKADFLQYAATRLKLTDLIVERVFQEIAEGLASWDPVIRSSFLPKGEQDRFLALFEERRRRLGFILERTTEDTLELLERLAIAKGQGGHQSFFRQLSKQRKNGLQCLTEGQLAAAGERIQGSEGWQQGYRRLLALSRVS